MADDVVARAKADLEKYDPLLDRFRDDQFIGPMRVLVPDLIAEIEALRRDMAWHGITPSTLKET